MSSRARLRLFVALGLVVAGGLAFLVSPYASSSPDGLERVAIARGFDATATEHATADSPLADYEVRGVDDPKLSTGIAGVIGVGVCFAVCLVGGLFLRRHSSIAQQPSMTSEQ